jgi:hypothetical protein
VAGDSAAAVSGLPAGVSVYLNGRTKIDYEACGRLICGLIKSGALVGRHFLEFASLSRASRTARERIQKPGGVHSRRRSAAALERASAASTTTGHEE